MAEPVERTTALIALRPGREDALRALGVELPPLGRFIDHGGLVLARVAPGQVLAMREGADAPLMEELAPLAGAAGVIDLSDSRVGVRFAGADARERLALLVPIDLHPSRFSAGCCAQTLMSHLNVLLLQVAEDAYEIQCGRSFAGSFMRVVEAV